MGAFSPKILIFFPRGTSHGFQNFLVYAGIWGYNGVLAMPCISCVFYAFGKMSFLLGLVDTIAVGFAQYALRATMTLQVCK